MVRELGLERRETVRSLSAVGVGNLKEAAPSTRGPEWTEGGSRREMLKLASKIDEDYYVAPLGKQSQT